MPGAGDPVNRIPKLSFQGLDFQNLTRPIAAFLQKQFGRGAD
jgi:hypothetical protein